MARQPRLLLYHVPLARRELQNEQQRLQFIGVPQPPCRPEVLAAVEQAWFEHLPLAITYVDKRFVESKRRVRIERVIIDRSETRLVVADLDNEERRELRLSGITTALCA